MSKKIYFETPAQLLFRANDIDDELHCGIGYRTEIICACCGGVFDANEADEIYPYGNWLNLTDEIFGGEYPEEFPYECRDEIPV